jgi:endogenous inhibitor of DNA gyrase (YacG/DUF329 family)
MQYVSGTARPMVGGQPSVPVHARGRRCGCEGCDTILSIYNPTDYCGLHARDCEPEEATFTRRRNDGDVISRTCAYEGCQHTFETANARRAYCSDRCRMAAFEQRRKRQRMAAQQQQAVV